MDHGLILYIIINILGCVSHCCNCGFNDCQDYLMIGHNLSGSYHVTPMGMVDGFSIMCDMDGGWIVCYFYRINASRQIALNIMV